MMNWSWKIASISEINIRLHWTLLAFLVWIGIANLTNRGVSAALMSLGAVGMVFGFVVLHELGHALTAQRFGIRTRDITLLPIGGIARLQKIPEDPHQEILIALAGPAVNLVLAVIFVTAIIVLHGVRGFTLTPNSSDYFLSFGLLVNLAMAIFNLIPAFPMDGGRVLRALLVNKYGYQKATEIAASIGQFLAIILGVLGIFTNGMLIFIALFVYLGAHQEAHFVQAHSLLAGVPAREAMRSHFVSLDVDDHIDVALNEFIAGNQHDFPVVDHNHRVCGMVYRIALLRALSPEPAPETVGQIMERNFCYSSDDMSLERVFEAMNENECSVMPVLCKDEVVGLISLETIGEWLMIHSRQVNRPFSATVRSPATSDEKTHRGSPTVV